MWHVFCHAATQAWFCGGGWWISEDWLIFCFLFFLLNELSLLQKELRKKWQTCICLVQEEHQLKCTHPSPNYHNICLASFGVLQYCVSDRVLWVLTQHVKGTIRWSKMSSINTVRLLAHIKKKSSCAWIAQSIEMTPLVQQLRPTSY